MFVFFVHVCVFVRFVCLLIALSSKTWSVFVCVCVNLCVCVCVCLIVKSGFCVFVCVQKI